MSCTVFANGRGVVHTESGGRSTVYPDVCLTPSGDGMKPIPYANTGEARDTSEGPTSVEIDGCMPMVKSAKYRKTSGDEPGTGGGVVSGVNRQVAEFISYSYDVKLEGKNACRLGDTLFHNRKNASG
jgi:hypothetical protein